MANSAFPEASTSSRRWAWFRLVLGQAQIAGATATLVLLLQSGLTVIAVSCAIVTAVLTILSVKLFRSSDCSFSDDQSLRGDK